MPITSMFDLTTLHVVLSLVGIASGLVAAYGMLSNQKLEGWVALFLATTVLTSATGFPLAPAGFDPAQAIGVLSLVVLAVAILARYVYRLAGPWRWVYVVTALLALYFNVFVAVIQAFQKVSFLQPLAPTQSEPPFLVAQLAVIAIFIVVGIIAVRTFRPAGAHR